MTGSRPSAFTAACKASDREMEATGGGPEVSALPASTGAWLTPHASCARVSRRPGGTSSATGWLNLDDSVFAQWSSAPAPVAVSTRCGIWIRSRRAGEISPIRMCSGASAPPWPRQVTSRRAGSR